MRNLLTVAIAVTAVLAAGRVFAQTGEEQTAAGEKASFPAPEAVPAAAEEEAESPFAGGVDLAVNSAYIWRGVELNPDDVFQPEVWLSAFGLGASIWGNLDMTGYHEESGQFNEADFKGFYSFELEDFSATLSYIYYHYPLRDYEKTQEIGAELSWGKPLSLNLEAYYDFDLVKGVYLKPSVSYEIEIDPFTLTPKVGLGWASCNCNRSNFEVDREALADLTAGLEISTDLGEGLYFTLRGEYYVLVDGQLREAAGSSEDGFWGGGSLGFEF